MAHTHAIAIVGATGLVGTTLLALLRERNFPIKKLYLVASYQSAGKKYKFANNDYLVEDLANFDFHRTNIAFFCVGTELSAEYGKGSRPQQRPFPLWRRTHPLC